MNMLEIILLVCIFYTNILLSYQDTVKVSLYYEALCPYSEEFITDQLYPGYQVLGNALTVEMIPYGKAKRKKVNNEWKIVCQHGPKECYANKIQACVLGLNHTQSESLNFIDCVMSTGNPQNKKYAKKCANKNKLSWRDIKTCVTDKQGTQLIEKFGEKTDNLIPKLEYVPHILFNDKFDEVLENDARNDFLETVCKMFTEKPNGC
nr:GILT-like protein 1 [Leptinotarsa decemlineata]